MKKIITSIIILISLQSVAQTITSFYSTPMSSFAIVNSSTSIDQSTTGTNLTWNFNSLSKTGNSVDTYDNPTAGELTTYPGTTSVLTITSTVSPNTSVSKLYTKNNSNQISFTAVKNPEFELNYASNNALVATFPINYGYSNSDPVVGNYVYTTYSGTFSGTMTSTFDAYGTLNTNDVGFGPFNGSASRLKMVQNLNLNYGAIPNVGTVSQTTYNYYSNSTGYLVFRYSTITINVPLLSINQTTTSIETFETILLSNSDYDFLSHNIFISPNPVNEKLNISHSENIKINYLKIFDVTGKELSLSRDRNSVDVNDLQNGVYFVNIHTDKGTFTKKIIKQ